MRLVQRAWSETARFFLLYAPCPMPYAIMRQDQMYNVAIRK